MTTTYHTSSSDSSLISLTDEEVIYTKMNIITLTLREKDRKREGGGGQKGRVRGVGERERDSERGREGGRERGRER